MTDKLNQLKEQVLALTDTMKALVEEVVEEERKQVSIIITARNALVDAIEVHDQIAIVADESARAFGSVADLASRDLNKYNYLVDSLSGFDSDGTADDVEDTPLYTQGYEDGYDAGYEEGYGEGCVCSDAYEDGYNACLAEHNFTDDTDEDTDEDEGE